MQAENFAFEEELPTRESGVVACAYARETEALLARGENPDDATALTETSRPPLRAEHEDAGDLDAIVHVIVSCEELAWFPLGEESGAIAAAADGQAPARIVLERAGLPVDEGSAHLAMLVDMGVVALRANDTEKEPPR